MKKEFFYVLICFLFCSSVKAQIEYTYPKGYVAYFDDYGMTPRADGDFDGDGANDVAIICQNNNTEDVIVAVFLSSHWLASKTYFYFPIYASNFKLTFNNQSLNIDADDDYDFYSFKFKYSDILSGMRLTSYAHTYYMRHPTILMAKNYINLISGNYSYNDGASVAFNAPVITLSNIDNYLEYLSTLGGDFYKN